MKIFDIKIWVIIATFAMLSLGACQSADGNQTGSEFVPDMAHSVAYEANVTSGYWMNTFDETSVRTRESLEKARLPVKGTIPRGSAGSTANHKKGYGIKIPESGSVPYYYADTEEERTRAMAEIINNPIPITAAGLESGKLLYNINCGICHGEKIDGNGWLVADENPNQVYPAAPANFLTDEHVNATNGRYYHAIMHGKNVMGGYSDKLSYEERWNVIHYIRSLQAKEKGLAYNNLENTFGAGATVGGSVAPKVTEVVTHESHSGVHHSAGDHSHDDGHSHDAGHEGNHGHEGGTEEHHHGDDGHKDDHSH